MLKIEHLRKHFGKQVVLDDISLEVNRGEVLSIIGQSGMGKSIILKHIVGLIIPDGGRVVLDGEEVSSPAMHQRDFDKHRRRFGMLFQGAALFDSKSVGENIAFPLREHTTMSVEEIRDASRSRWRWSAFRASSRKCRRSFRAGCARGWGLHARWR